MSNAPSLSWSQRDPEERLGVSGGRFTSTRSALSAFIAVIITICAYGCAIPFKDHPYVQMFTERGAVQYVTVFFFFWCLVTLLFKVAKIRVQRGPLRQQLVPNDATFVLSAATAPDIIARLHEICEDPRRFILFNRLDLALSNLRNMGRISDFTDVLEAQADNDEGAMESSYSLLKGLIWSIPVLGFIGTVQGLSSAVGNFGSAINSSAEVSALKPALKGVTSGLAVAFETTFVALVAALTIQLILTVVKKAEEEMLDDFKDYTQRAIISRLRILPFERGA